MTIEVKHATQATGTDAGNGEIAKTQWNESHAISMAGGAILGRSTAGAGPAEEIAISTGLSLSAGALSAAAGTVVDAAYVHTDNNYTTTEKSKLAGIADGAEVNVNADWNAVSGDAQILNKPTLGTAAAASTTDFATAAQGAKADTALQPAAIGVSVQAYDADLTSWAAIAPSTKQDTLVSGTNIKTVNGNSLLGSGDVAISGGSSIPVSDEGTQITAGVTSLNFTGAGVTASAAGNAVTVNVPGGGSSTLTIQNKTAAYTVVAGDNGTIINCNHFSAFTVSLTAAATLGAGFNCWVWAVDAAITIDPNGSETIDGVATLILRQGEGVQIVCDGTNWQTGGKKTMRMYAENLSASFARPIASSGGALALGYNSRSSVAAQASNSAAVAISGNASGSSSTAVGDGASATANNASAFGYSTTASGSNASAIGSSTTASASNSTAIGLNSGTAGSQAVTGSGAMALGGSYASGTDSFAAAVADNTNSYGATGANSVAIGFRAKATGSSAIALGGYGAQASGSYSLAIGGSPSARATASNSIAIGGFNSSCIASKTTSVAIGDGARSDVIGKFAFASSASSGDAQTGKIVIRRNTTDATATVLTSDNAASAATNQVILPNNSAYAFTGTVVARQQAAGGTQSAAWKVEGLIRREGSAGTTTLVASTVTAISNVPGWTLALSADTTNGGLAVTATGAAATNIRWVATIKTSEVTYA